MESSPTIGLLAEALSKAQGEMIGAKKDSANPYFKSKYADLASIWDACRAPLSKNNLSIIQIPQENGIETILAHSSGEWIKGFLEIKPVKEDPQAIGSAITYARRYALAAMVGIAPEDDDGNAATGKQESEKEKPAATPKKAPSKKDGESFEERVKKAIQYMEKEGYGLDQLVLWVEKPQEKWTSDDLAHIRKCLKESQESYREIMTEDDPQVAFDLLIEDNGVLLNHTQKTIILKHLEEKGLKIN